MCNKRVAQHFKLQMAHCVAAPLAAVVLNPTPPPVQGLVYEGRPTGRLTPQKLEFARSASEADRAPSGGSLLEAVQQLQPSALIGAAAKQGAFSAETIKALTKVSSSSPLVALRMV